MSTKMAKAKGKPGQTKLRHGSAARLVYGSRPGECRASPSPKVGRGGPGVRATPSTPIGSAPR